MTPLEVYKRLLLKVNKNDTNANIKIPRGEFVLLFNSELLKWLSYTLGDKEDTDAIEDVYELYEADKELTFIAEKPFFTEFALPNDFFAKSSTYCVATKGDCKDIILTAWDFKPKNKSVITTNDNHSPSFEFRETLFSLTNNKLLIYRDDFTVNKVYISYYRQPIALDIEGYKHIDGTSSTNIATDLGDFNIEEVLNNCAKAILGNYQNVEAYQVADKAIQESRKK